MYDKIKSCSAREQQVHISCYAAVHVRFSLLYMSNTISERRVVFLEVLEMHFLCLCKNSVDSTRFGISIIMFFFTDLIFFYAY
jgi:hypothetical protein